MMEPFKLNDEYEVFPGTNTVNFSVKLEPRLMKLLCLLVANAGALVTREEIVQKIWNGYGGGDEGLTQAISNLRKILGDTDRTVIETVPKGGYIFRGRIGPVNGSITPFHQPGVIVRYKGYKVAGITAIILSLIFGLIIYTILSRQNIAPKAPPAKTQTEQAAPKP